MPERMYTHPQVVQPDQVPRLGEEMPNFFDENQGDTQANYTTPADTHRQSYGGVYDQFPETDDFTAAEVVDDPTEQTPSTPKGSFTIKDLGDPHLDRRYKGAALVEFHDKFRYNTDKELWELRSFQEVELIEPVERREEGIVVEAPGLPGGYLRVMGTTPQLASEGISATVAISVAHAQRPLLPAANNLAGMPDVFGGARPELSAPAVPSAPSQVVYEVDDHPSTSHYGTDEPAPNTQNTREPTDPFRDTPEPANGSQNENNRNRRKTARRIIGGLSLLIACSSPWIYGINNYVENYEDASGVEHDEYHWLAEIVPY